jgi:hypothetical protein
LLKRSQATLIGNVIGGDAWKPYRGVLPSLGNYRGIWDWDSAFHAVGISHSDPELARDQFKILFGKQLHSGGTTRGDLGEGGHRDHLQQASGHGMAVAFVDHSFPDIRFLQEIYPKLIKLGDFWVNERGGAADGLLLCGHGCRDDLAWDNTICWDNGYRYSKSNDHRFWAIDLNCYINKRPVSPRSHPTQ